VCTGELCDLGDTIADLGSLEANVVVVTCDTVAVNRRWAADNGYGFPVLSDFWPHGAMTRAYDAFDEARGVPFRISYVLDARPGSPTSSPATSGAPPIPSRPTPTPWPGWTDRPGS